MFDFIIAGYRWFFLQLAGLVGYGWGIVALSFITSAAMMPLMKMIAGVVRRETEYQGVILPQIAEINKAYATDIERNLHIQRLYARYAYSPLSAVKKVLPLFVQIPFLLITYYMLKNTEAIQGQGFLFLRDLGIPDSLVSGRLLSFLYVIKRGMVSAEGHSINLLPLVMTGINVATAFSTIGFARREIIQSIVIAFLFLVLLYSAPSALLLYWTINNLISFFRALSANNWSGIGLLMRRVRSLNALSVLSRQPLFVCALAILFWMGFYFFSVCLAFNPMREARGGLTFTLSYGGMVVSIALASVASCFVLCNEARRYLVFAIISGLPSVALGFVLTALFYLSQDGFWKFLRRVDLFFVFVVVALFCIMPYLVFGGFRFRNAVKASLSALRDHWEWVLFPSLFALHYSLSVANTRLSAQSIVLLIVYMNLPVLLVFFVSVFMWNKWLDCGKLLRIVVGAFVGIYTVPLISADEGILAFDQNITIRVVLIATSAVIFGLLDNRRFIRCVVVLLLVCVGLECHKIGGSINEPAAECDVPCNRGDIDSLSCVKSNNVYLLVYDGYAHKVEREALDLSPDFDVEKYLQSNGFVVYDAYSTGSDTIESMSSVFEIAGIKGSTDRATMVGDNAFCDFLRRGGFCTYYLLCGYVMPDYGARMPGDYYFPQPSKIIRYENVIFSCILRGYFARTPQAFNDYTHDQWLEAKAKMLAEMGTGRHFIYTHSSFPGHANRSPSAHGPVYDKRTNDTYAEWIIGANKEIRRDIAKIVADDPAAIVIVASDHGAHLMMPDTEGNIDARHLIDRHGVLLGIRWPEDYSPCIKLNCLQNVLLEVMIYLSGDTNLVKYANPGITHSVRWPIQSPAGMVKNGLLTTTNESLSKSALSKFLEESSHKE